MGCVLGGSTMRRCVRAGAARTHPWAPIPITHHSAHAQAASPSANQPPLTRLRQHAQRGQRPPLAVPPQLKLKSGGGGREGGGAGRASAWRGGCGSGRVGGEVSEWVSMCGCAGGGPRVRVGVWGEGGCRGACCWHGRGARPIAPTPHAHAPPHPPPTPPLTHPRALEVECVGNLAADALGRHHACLHLDVRYALHACMHAWRGGWVWVCYGVCECVCGWVGAPTKLVPPACVGHASHPPTPTHPPTPPTTPQPTHTPTHPHPNPPTPTPPESRWRRRARRAEPASGIGSGPQSPRGAGTGSHPQTLARAWGWGGGGAHGGGVVGCGG